MGPASVLWALPEPQRLLRKQQADGAWRYPGGNPATTSGGNYAVLETFRSLGILVEKFGFDSSHPAIRIAAEYLFSCQTAEGDLRGILGNQYMPYYHAAILELLIVAGYAEDARVICGQAQECKAGDMLMADQAGVISSIVYGPDERTRITAATRNVLCAAYAPTGVAAGAVQAHLQDIRDYVLIVAPAAQVQTMQVIPG